MSPKKILVLCTGNSCRSQMMEGYLKHFCSSHAEVYSAGIEVHGLNPKAVAVMKEDGIDISGQTSNHVDEYRHMVFDIVLTVCDHARETCPVFPHAGLTVHQNFPDPAQAAGSESEVMDCFRKVRDLIKTYARQFCREYVKYPDSG